MCGKRARRKLRTKQRRPAWRRAAKCGATVTGMKFAGIKFVRIGGRGWSGQGSTMRREWVQQVMRGLMPARCRGGGEGRGRIVAGGEQQVPRPPSARSRNDIRIELEILLLLLLLLLFVVDAGAADVNRAGLDD
jgi:hypothetical protein